MSERTKHKLKDFGLKRLQNANSDLERQARSAVMEELGTGHNCNISN